MLLLRIKSNKTNMLFEIDHFGLSDFINYDILLSFNVVNLKLVNSEDPEEMPPYKALKAAFYLGIHCLPNYMFTEWLA